MSIKKIDKGLARYYKIHGRNDYFKTGKGKFEEFSEDNNIDDEFIIQELGASAKECMLLGFDDNFPGVKEYDFQAIFDIVMKCYKQGEYAFDSSFAYTYEISEQDMQVIENLYKSQCPKSFLATIIKDKSTFTVMAIGQKKQSPYIQNLTDDYLRSRVEVFLENKKTLTISEWTKDHPHFRKLKDMDKHKYEIVGAACAGFTSRICPVLLFRHVLQIEGSLLETTNLIKSAIEFVVGKAKAKNVVNVPFQLDVCIAYDPMKRTVDAVDDDDDYDPDDDDYDDEKSLESVDMIDDIIKKLESNKNNGVKYAKAKGMHGQVITDCYKKYQDESKTESLQYQRIIAFVDKRSNPFKFDEKNKPDEKEHIMIVFSPPNDCNKIPKDTVNEWYLSSSSISLIPNENYKLQKMMQWDNESKYANRKQIPSKVKLQNQNINSKEATGMITLSFHVKSSDSIACYIYTMGEYMRFMPSDIINILPLLFDENCDNNKSFTERLDKDCIPRMEELLIDEQFQKFRKMECRKQTK